MITFSFQDLKIWKKGIELVDLVYSITATFPPHELYALAAQSNKSAVSIPSNIAEGSQRTTDKDFAHFILIAKGSLAELHTQMIIAQRRKYIAAALEKEIFVKIEELNKMLFSFHKRLKADS